MTQLVASPPTDKTFFGQPRELAHLFGVEMWERFSFYGMQGILLIYLYYLPSQGGLGISQLAATSIVGAYGGLVYLSTILGAWLADRVIGSERTLFYAACLVMVGHLGLALIPGIAGVAVGLVAIALGSGGVKANCTSMVGQLYRPDDVRRDAGFSLFYLGINLGGLIGPLVTGFFQTSYGFHLGFGVAAVGMAVGLIQYSLTRRSLGDIGRLPPNPLPSAHRPRVVLAAVVAIVLITVAFVTGVVKTDNLSDVVAIITLLSAITYFTVILTSSRITTIERRRVAAFIPLFIASAAFWSLYQQQFTVLTVYSDKQLNREIFGWTMPVSWIQSINPVFIILLSGVFAALWTKLGSRQPSTPVKFALGTIVMGLAFWLFLPMASTVPNSAPLIGMVGILFVFTIAELLISPVGLSLSTKLAPANFRTQMVSLLFLSVALGTSLSGTLAGYYHVDSQQSYFAILGAVAVLFGLLLLANKGWILRLMGGVR
jgi:POT family proton-dependent oligopeptide transporter